MPTVRPSSTYFPYFPVSTNPKNAVKYDLVHLLRLPQSALLVTAVPELEVLRAGRDERRAVRRECNRVHFVLDLK